MPKTPWLAHSASDGAVPKVTKKKITDLNQLLLFSALDVQSVDRNSPIKTRKVIVKQSNAGL